MAVAGVVLDDGDVGLFDDGSDKRLAAARDAQVDLALHLEQFADGRAVSGLNELHGSGVDARGFDALLHALGDGLVGVQGFLAAAEDGRVA